VNALLLLPAAAVVLAVMSVAAVSARLSSELAELRRSLRSLSAAAVAGDELARSLHSIGDLAAGLRSEAPRRLRRVSTTQVAG